MKTTHTPGPWIITEHAWYETGIYAGKVQIAMISIYEEANEETQEALEERTAANACLIAAAPDLLAALQAAVECHMVPISSAREGGAVAFSIQTRVADQIRDAIAKATGAA